MAWVAQKELDAAVDAMEALAATLTSHSSARLKIRHESQSYSREKWANVLCSVLASARPLPDCVMPENTYLMQKPRDFDNAA